VVSQILWMPHTVTDRRQHVEDADLKRPIFFLHTDGRLGLALEAAVGGQCDTLLNSHCCAPLGGKTTTHIRIGVSETFFFSTLVDFRLLMISLFYSGVGISSSSGRYKSATKRPRAIPSLWPSSYSTLGDLWIFSSGTPKWIPRTLSHNGVSARGVFSATKSLSLVLSRSQLAVGCRSCNSPIIYGDIHAFLRLHSSPYGYLGPKSES
jgi:hypothetical protein